MKNKVVLHIPEPCHENWKEMKPVEQGRFCMSCSKQVVDFSNKSDKEILAILSRAAGTTCGRFSNSQLERPLINPTSPVLTPYRLFLSAIIPAFILSNLASAQTVLKGKVRTVPQPNLEQRMLGEVAFINTNTTSVTGRVVNKKGEPLPNAIIKVNANTRQLVSAIDGTFAFTPNKTAKANRIKISCVGYVTKEITLPKNEKNLVIALADNDIIFGVILAPIKPLPVRVNELSKTINGKVINEEGNTVPFASVSVDNSNTGVVCDSMGNFSLSLKFDKKNADLSASGAGYKPLQRRINIENDQHNDIVLQLSRPEPLPDVTVVTYANERRNVRVGGLSVVRTISVADTIKTIAAKLTGTQMFNVYPNPAQRGAVVNLTFKKAGAYSVQLFNNNGSLFVSKEIVNAPSQRTTVLVLPTTLTAGTYYIRATNASGAKSQVVKVIIQ